MKKSDLIIKFLKWVGSAIEDQGGSVSSKRIGMFLIIILLFRITDKVLVMSVIPTNLYLLLTYIIGVALILALVFLGVIAKEFFLKYGIPLLNKPDKSITENTETTETANNNN